MVAAASNAARMVRLGGGFAADADPPVMTAQIQLDDVPDAAAAPARAAAARARILAAGDAAIPRMVARGGGCRELDCRVLDEAAGVVVVEVHVDVGDAMGANLVDSVAERAAPVVARAVGGRIGLRILTNLPLRRRARARCEVSADAVGGDAIADGIARASRFAELESGAGRDPQQGHHERHRRRRGRARPGLARARGRGPRLGGARRPLRADRDLAADRRAGSPARSSCRWRSASSAAAPTPRRSGPRSSWSARPRRASWPGSWPRSGWRRTWARCGPWPARASSTATCGLHRRRGPGARSDEPAPERDGLGGRAVSGLEVRGERAVQPGSGAMFDQIAPRYDLLNRIMSFGADRRWRRRTVRALDPRRRAGPGPRPGDRHRRPGLGDRAPPPAGDRGRHRSVG